MAAGVIVTLLTPPAFGNVCHVVDVDFTTADDGASNHFPPQVVVWIEDAAGNYIDTLYITQKTGTYGIGNRPGRMDFKSGPLFPYGRREETFPIWSHRHGVDFPRVVFRYYTPEPCNSNTDCANQQLHTCDLGNHECASSVDSELSHSQSVSSLEYHFCRPLMPTEPKWNTAIDAGSCATSAYSDKGEFSPSLVSHYPPRSDLQHASEDSADSMTYETLNPFDAVSQATSPAGQATQVIWPLPNNLPDGDYVIFVETSKEFDFNTTYNATSYPPPILSSYNEYGAAARGQPSVLYSVPFSVKLAESSAVAASYAGYGDPDGLDGSVRPPDATIDETPGTGAGRLQLVSDGAATYRVRVAVNAENDSAPPGAPLQARAGGVDSNHAEVSFAEAGDDGTIGTVRGYEIRYRADDEITDANFASSSPINTVIHPQAPGTLQDFALDGLLPLTHYSVGIRAYDDCHNIGPMTVLDFTTADRKTGAVDACFIATAAYGSLMANEVNPLRKFRDQVLRHTALGELAVESYYTFGPAFAGAISESELLRATARDALAPLIRFVKTFE